MSKEQKRFETIDRHIKDAQFRVNLEKQEVEDISKRLLEVELAILDLSYESIPFTTINDKLEIVTQAVFLGDIRLAALNNLLIKGIDLKNPYIAAIISNSFSAVTQVLAKDSNPTVLDTAAEIIIANHTNLLSSLDNPEYSNYLAGKLHDNLVGALKNNWEQIYPKIENQEYRRGLALIIEFPPLSKY